MENAVGAVGPITRRIFVANLVANIAIVITGGGVRLSKSGLGCPTWPDCVDGSLVPTASQLEGIHKIIEFGNRLLTFVLAAIAIAALVAAVRDHRARKRRGVATRPILIGLASATLLGIVGQAVLGGVTVLTGLHPTTVAAHFLLSMALIAAAAVLVIRSAEPGDRPVLLAVRSEIRWATVLLTVVGVLVLVAGTVVTGTGPHSGDADTPTRFGFDWRTVSWLHADLVILFLGLLAATLLGLRLTNAPVLPRRRALQLLAASLIQGAIGYVQYFLGVPEILVALHMLGACLVWLATVALLLSTRTRGVAALEQSFESSPPDLVAR